MCSARRRRVVRLGCRVSTAPSDQVLFLREIALQLPHSATHRRPPRLSRFPPIPPPHLDPFDSAAAASAAVSLRLRRRRFLHLACRLSPRCLHEVCLACRLSPRRLHEFASSADSPLGASTSSHRRSPQPSPFASAAAAALSSSVAASSPATSRFVLLGHRRFHIPAIWPTAPLCRPCIRPSPSGATELSTPASARKKKGSTSSALDAAATPPQSLRRGSCPVPSSAPTAAPFLYQGGSSTQLARMRPAVIHLLQDFFMQQIGMLHHELFPE